jgi:nucleotide-binding universal stress UspA family protein
LDGSSLAEQILPYAIQQALHFNSTVTLLQVTEPSTVGVITAPVFKEDVEGETEAVLEQIRKVPRAAETYLDGIAQRYGNSGVHIRYDVVGGLQPGPTIVEYARRNENDLIALTTHGRSGLSRAVLGSTTDHVLREYGSPLLVIKAREEG